MKLWPEQWRARGSAHAASPACHLLVTDPPSPEVSKRPGAPWHREGGAGFGDSCMQFKKVMGWGKKELKDKLSTGIVAQQLKPPLGSYSP